MKKLKASFLVLAFLITGMLSVRVSNGQTIQRSVATATAGPTLTSAPQPVTISPWEWSSFNQPQIQLQQAPYRTYWTNPNPNRIFPALTKEGLATFWRSY
ncbi:MAG TPA: hypothetical protein VGO56_16360 [Pyrinomonadaceae bacterium]|jgi:hypothetical protein|nr:hypothetical protein [Pyrinomonadaceae bacterium]